jgi:hypothetical protein
MTRHRAQAAPRAAGSLAAGALPRAASALPAGMGLANLGVFLLCLGDLATVGALVAQLLTAAAPANSGSDTFGMTGLIGAMLGTELAFAYALFPLQFLTERVPVGVAAYRLLCGALLILHPLVIALLAVDLAVHRQAALSFVFMTAPIAVLATPFVYPVGRNLLKLRWLDLACPPEQWERMPGVDGASTGNGRAQDAQPTAAWLAMLLPFLAAARAGKSVLAVLAFLLWAGGLAALATSSFRGALPLILAAGIGWRTGQAGGPDAAPGQASPPANPAERASRLRALFPADRLRPPPRFVAAGFVALPVLFLLDALAVIAFASLERADSLEGFLGMVEGSAVVLIVLIPFLVYPLLFAAPLGTRIGIALYRLLGAVLVLVHAGATCTLAAVSFRLSLLDRDLAVPQAVEPLLWPLTVALILTLPLVLVLALSLPAAGRLPAVLKT